MIEGLLEAERMLLEDATVLESSARRHQHRGELEEAAAEQVRARALRSAAREIRRRAEKAQAAADQEVTAKVPLCPGCRAKLST